MLCFLHFPNLASSSTAVHRLRLSLFPFPWLPLLAFSWMRGKERKRFANKSNEVKLLPSANIRSVPCFLPSLVTSPPTVHLPLPFPLLSAALLSSCFLLQWRLSRTSAFQPSLISSAPSPSSSPSRSSESSPLTTGSTSLNGT